MHEFQERHPKAAISISVHSSRNVVEAVRSKRAAFGICLVRERLPELEYTHLFTRSNRIGFFCGPTHRLFGKTNLSIKDLRGGRAFPSTPIR
ncbi:MAG: LysR substrate-binding domain-containing protein [Parvularculaceae bacterium]